MCVTRVIVHVCACVMYVCLIWMCDVLYLIWMCDVLYLIWMCDAYMCALYVLGISALNGVCD